MKKNYIIPVFKTVNIKPTTLLGDSIDVDSENTAGERGWGAPQSSDLDFSEEASS